MFFIFSLVFVFIFAWSFGLWFDLWPLVRPSVFGPLRFGPLRLLKEAHCHLKGDMLLIIR
jgi:hypothetical protein